MSLELIGAIEAMLCPLLGPHSRVVRTDMREDAPMYRRGRHPGGSCSAYDTVEVTIQCSMTELEVVLRQHREIAEQGARYISAGLALPPPEPGPAHAVFEFNEAAASTVVFVDPPPPPELPATTIEIPVRESRPRPLPGSWRK